MASEDQHFEALELDSFNYDLMAPSEKHRQGSGDSGIAGLDYTSSTPGDSVLPTPFDFSNDLALSTNCAHCADTNYIFCDCRFAFPFSPLGDLGNPSISLPVRERNEAGSPSAVQEMETAGVLLPQYPHALPVEPSRMTEQAHPLDGIEEAFANRGWGNSPAPNLTMEANESLYETPGKSGYVDHLQASNVRESVKHEADYPGDQYDEEAARILANGSKSIRQLEATSEVLRAMSENLQLEDAEWKGFGGYEDPQEAIITSEPSKETAFAMIELQDCDYYIKQYDVYICRSEEAVQEARRRRKEQKRARELAEYRKEPSQPSQPGDEDQQVFPSNSSQSLEGRPAPPSNFSEHGGAVSYHHDSDDELSFQHSRRRKHGSMYAAKSSSTNSIAPASLEASSGYKPHYEFDDNGEPKDRDAKAARIDVHPQDLEHIMKISKEHLKFSYNFQAQRWELHVLGNRAFVNEEIVERGSVVPLHHGDEIFAFTVRLVFKLPVVCRESPGVTQSAVTQGSTSEGEELSDEDDAIIGTSPVRRLSDAMDTIEGDEEDDDEDAVEPRVEKKRGRPPNKKTNVEDTKGKPKKQPPKTKAEKAEKSTAKGKKKEKEPSAESVEMPTKVDKGKAPAKDAPGASEEPKPSTSQPAPPIEPGSGLEGIPVDQLPQRRKGPGRPPKNGLVSKRDNALVARKRRELEKEGKPVPDFNQLVDIVRRETKAKELQSRGAASGSGFTLPDIPIVQSIETAAHDNAFAPPVASGAEVPTTSLATVERRPSSPKPKRERERSLSPIKPESECTEEELRKPSGTYVHIIDEILQVHPKGEAELQTIYHLMMKKYPYYKYKCNTTGWQSSVRHNLLQTKRFKDVGKAGKGRVWGIDYTVPLEKEKNRVRQRSPQQMQGPMPNGLPGPSQQQHYGNPYAQALPNGQPQFNNAGAQPGHGAYASPYAHPNHYPGSAQPGAPQYQQSRSASQGTQPVNAQNAQHGRQASSAAPAPVVLNPLVQNIMAYQTEYLKPFMPVQSPAYQKHQKFFSDCLNAVDAGWTKQGGLGNLLQSLTSENEKTICVRLDRLFAQHYDRKDFEKQSADAAKTAEGNQSVQQTVADASQKDGNGGGTAVMQQGPVPAPQVSNPMAGTAIAAPAQPAPVSTQQSTQGPGAQAQAPAQAATVSVEQAVPRSGAPVQAAAQVVPQNAEPQASMRSKRAAEDEPDDTSEAKRVKEES